MTRFGSIAIVLVSVSVTLLVIIQSRRRHSYVTANLPLAIRTWSTEAEYSRGNDDAIEPSRETARIKIRTIVEEGAPWRARVQWVAVNTSRSPMFRRGTQYVLSVRRRPQASDLVAPIRAVTRSGSPDLLVSEIPIGVLAPDTNQLSTTIDVELGSAAMNPESRLIEHRIHVSITRSSASGDPLILVNAQKMHSSARYGRLETPLLRVRVDNAYDSTHASGPGYPPFPGDIAAPLPRPATIPRDDILRAALTGDAFMLKAAVARGAQLDQPDELGRTALDMLYAGGHFELLHEYSRLALTDPLGLKTPLNAALLAKDGPGFQRLLDSGVDPNVRPMAGAVIAPLELALRLRNVDAVTALLKAHADPERETEAIGSALGHALEDNYSDGISLLLRHGVNPHWGAVIAAARGSVEILEMFQQRNQATLFLPLPSTGETPLMVAALYGHVDAVAYIISKGANPEIQDHLGRDAFVYARAGGRSAVHDFMSSAKKVESRASATVDRRGR